MRYLSSISLALVVHVLLSIGILMALACTATPAVTPTPPGPMLSEAEAIAVVKSYLGLKNVGRLQCFAYYDVRDPRWTARYDGNGVWKVKVDVVAEEVVYKVGSGTYSAEQLRQRSQRPGKWDLYEKTKSVVVASNNYKNC